MRLAHRVAVATIAAPLLSAVLAAAPAGATARPPRTTITCGQTITTSIKVANDLTCDGGGAALIIVGEGVTVDLKGHEVVQATPPGCQLPPQPATQRCGVDVGVGATVTNGKLHTSLGLRGGTARQVSVDGPMSMLYGQGSDGVFQGSTLDHSRMTGWLLWGTWRSTITNSRLVGTTILFDDTFTNLSFSIRDNVIESSEAHAWPNGNFRGAIHIQATYRFPKEVNGEIVGNRIVGSRGHGIAFSGWGPNMGRLVIADNILRSNAGSGLWIKSGLSESPNAPPGGPVTISGNRASSNGGGHGIDLDAIGMDIVDGGGNIARRNAVNPQCVGLLCQPR
jgi:hypothetical protein